MEITKLNVPNQKDNKPGKHTAIKNVGLEQDALFKQIGGQLDSGFNYNEWQRSKQPTKKQSISNKVIEDTIIEPQLQSENTEIIVSSANLLKITKPKRTQRPKKKNRSPSRTEIIDIKKEERIKILTLKVNKNKKEIQDQNERFAFLEKENIRLIKDIETSEKLTYDEVRRILKRYDKFKSGIVVLNDNFKKEYEDLELEFFHFKKIQDKEIEKLQVLLQNLEESIEANHNSVHNLMCYKDKEYPIKAAKISQLTKEIRLLEYVHTKEEKDLEKAIGKELDNVLDNHKFKQQNLVNEISEQLLSEMHPHLVEMAKHNCIMKHEIEKHKIEKNDLNIIINQLTEEVKQLVQDPKTNVRLQMFPEFFPSTEKCTPDMEIILDIPREKWLPI